MNTKDNNHPQNHLENQMKTDLTVTSVSASTSTSASSIPFPLFFDGAMGTYYCSQDGCEMESPEHATLEHPEIIQKIHQEYIQAGANAIKTCTFSVTSLLEKGEVRQAQTILENALRIARAAVQAEDSLDAEDAVQDSEKACDAVETEYGTPAEVSEKTETDVQEGLARTENEVKGKNTVHAREAVQVKVSAQERDAVHPAEVLKDGFKAADYLLETEQFKAEEFNIEQIEAEQFKEEQLESEEFEAEQKGECHGSSDSVLIFGDIGPAATYEKAAQLYIKQAQMFYDLGIRHLLVETLSSHAGIAELAKWASEQEEPVFLLASFAVGADGCTRSGLQGRKLLMETSEMAGVSAVGLNCQSGPHHLHMLQKELPVLSVPLSIMPNAGYPAIVGRKVQYEGSPAYFGSLMHQIYLDGALILGGCCGTTPEHIREMVVQSQKPGSAKKSIESQSVSFDESSDTLYEKLLSGRKVAAVELDPPKNDRIAPFMEHVSELCRAGADFITIADCPIGRPRADSSLLACKVRRELGVDVLPHMTCRDRNLNATKALLLGLSMENIHSVLLVTGDPLPSELRDEVQSVFSFHSRQLASYISSLQPDVLSSPFHLFGALNVNAPNFDIQLRFAKEKEANGMAGFLTQPVHSPRALENLKRARKELKGKILGGILPIVSERNARFLQNEISGMDIPEEIASLYAGKNREESEDVAIDLCLQTAKDMAEFVDGYYIMTPFQRVALISRLLSRMKQENLLAS